MMEKDPQTEKYILQNKLRTWSAYRKEQEEKRAKDVPQEIKKLEAAMAARLTYGGCVNGCNHPKNAFSAKEVNAQTLRDKLKVIEAGRDFGGSRSGAGSRVCSDDEASGSEEERPLIEGIGGGYRGRSGGHSGEPSDVMEDMVMQDQVAASNGSGVKL